VFAEPWIDAAEGPFRQALHDERLFWRNAQGGGVSALVAHAGLVAVETAGSVLRPRMLARLPGRAWACCQVGAYVRRHAELARLAGAVGAVSRREPIRLDRAHGSAAHSQTSTERASAS
jgi:hypothetical protein